CGYVTVPENRAKPFDDDNSIRLAVVVLRAADTHSTQSPTFLLGGGPGQDVIGMYEGLLKSYQSLQKDGFPEEAYPGHLQDMQQFMAVMDLSMADLQKREFIYFDQRGAGYSKPSLKCHGDGWRDCKDRLVSSGVDLPAYNTLENAADVNDIRLALGYEQINLQAGSYGTRLALEIMRQYPQIVRSAVVDGVAPPQVDWAAEMVRRYDDALQVLFDHCQANTACQAAYPDLETEFYTLVERLNVQPVEVQIGDGVETLNGDALRDTVWNALFDANKIRFLPMMIHQVSEGHTEVWGQILAPSGVGGDEESIAWGMHFATECSERWAFETPQDLVKASEELPPAIRESVVRDFADTFQDCEEWDVPPAPTIVHEPVQSDIPTLLLSGEFDPGTQPVFAELAAQTLSHHYSYVFPYLGHTDGFTSSCHASVVSAFLDDPYQAPDTSCIIQMDKPVFVVP
ncbi:MAG TPA: alpha/beta fold hydrolase, partial [Anaerolineales bacterium]|nr:alpha/beta fold hydrolase [Anaerolineales bacterium]